MRALLIILANPESLSQFLTFFNLGSSLLVHLMCLELSSSICFWSIIATGGKFLSKSFGLHFYVFFVDTRDH